MTSLRRNTKLLDEEIKNKSIMQVPGMTKKIAMSLRTQGITQASELYDHLEKLNFNKSKFHIWMRDTCGLVATGTIYKALMEEHNRHTSQDLTVKTQENRGQLSHLKDKMTPSPKGRRGIHESKSVPSPHEVPADTTDDLGSSESLQMFFTSFSHTCKNISLEFHTEMKIAILKIVNDFERKSERKVANNSM